MTRIAAALLTLALAACDGSTKPQPAPGGTEVILELGQTKRLDGTGITVGLHSVDDSRCPTRVQCIWEGNGRVVLDLRDAGGAEISAELNTPGYPRKLAFRYLTIELTALDPYPEYATANRVDYKAHLRWSYLPD